MGCAQGGSQGVSQRSWIVWSSSSSCSGRSRAPRQQLLELQVAAALLRVRLHDALDQFQAVDGPEDRVRRRVRHVDRRVLQVRPLVELAIYKPLIGVVRLALRVD